jgi:hypothetical protein
MLRRNLSSSRSGRLVAAALLILVGRVSAVAESGRPALAGTVSDPLGARVPGAIVSLVRDGKGVAESAADGQGRFSFAAVEQGRYHLRAGAAGFETQTTHAFFVSSGRPAVVDVSLQIGLRQELVVTASGTEEQPAQVARRLP